MPVMLVIPKVPVISVTPVSSVIPAIQVVLVIPVIPVTQVMLVIPVIPAVIQIYLSLRTWSETIFICPKKIYLPYLFDYKPSDFYTNQN